jgi:hypothetical protein
MKKILSVAALSAALILVGSPAKAADNSNPLSSITDWLDQAKESVENYTKTLTEKVNAIGKEIAGMDFGIAALGAVSKVGEILNRPKQQSSSSSTGSETSTTTTSVSGSPNLLGALMEGGATPVLESIQKRNQTAIETLSKQKNAWFLPAGESAQIVVSKLFEL